MHSFKCTLWSCLVSALVVRAVKNITIDDFDPRIVYAPSIWTHENSAATLERFNLTTSYTGQQALASIKFNGTAVYFMSYGLPSPNPDRYQVTVDGQTETRSLRVNSNSERAQFIAYSRTELDPSREHQITISNPFSIPLNIDAFIITVLDNSTMKDGFGSPFEAGTGSTQSNSESGLSAATKAGIAVALIGGILLGLAGALGIWYWRRQRKLKSRDNTSDPVGRMEGGVSAVQVSENPQTAPVGVFPFVEADGGVQRRPGEYRKDRRPNGDTYRAPEAQSEMDEGATTISSVTSPHPRPSSSLVIFPPPYAG